MKKALTDLDAGVYNIHYTAVPKTTTTAISGKVSATSKLVRKTLKLVVLPKELTGVAGNKLSSVELPTGWSWENPEATLDNNVGNYNAVFTNTANDTNQRTTALTLSVKVQANQ